MCASRIATPEKSFANDPGDLPEPSEANARGSGTRRLMGPAGRVALLALNTLPLLHVVGVVAFVIVPSWSWTVRLSTAAGILWLVPPLACRLLLMLCPLRDGCHSWGSATFWCWWTSLKLQTVFLRLPFLEELLRLVPGLYSAWMRLWGARVGRLTYWSPGVEITDRSLLDIGDDVVLGGKARLGAHVLRQAAGGPPELLLGRIRIGHRSSIGAQSTLGPGVRLADDEFTHAFFLAPPFSNWEGGRRIRNAAPPTSPSAQ
jgi:hypothetical protein